MAWKKVSGTYVLDVDVPANQTATVAIPNPGGLKYVGVGAGAPQLSGTANGYTTFTVGSGTTHFSIGDSQTGGVGGTVPATLASRSAHRRASARSRRAWPRTTRRRPPRT